MLQFHDSIDVYRQSQFLFQPFILLDNIPIIRLSFLVIGFELLYLLPEFCDNIVTAVVKEISIDDV